MHPSFHLRDPEAFSAAYKRLAPTARAAAEGVLRDAAAAEDVVQDVFCTLWVHPEGWSPERGSLTTYVRLMARSRFGSVRRLPSGRWQVRYRTSDGRQHTAPQTFPTRGDASRHLAQVEADLSRGQWSDPRLGRTTFAAWAERWEATAVNLRANTLAAYGNLLRRYLLPTFGPVPLAEIDVLAVRTWLAKLERGGVGASTRARRTGCCRAS